MTTRPYSDCLAQALALCGVPDSNATEAARIKTFINRRARQAYAESELWPRWLVVGEERIVSEDGLLPYEESGLQDIGTVLRIHESQPFVSDPAGEYTDWNAQSDGVQITGYQPTEHTDGSGITITGDATVEIYDFSLGADRAVPVAGDLVTLADQYNGLDQFSSSGAAAVDGLERFVLVRSEPGTGWTITVWFMGAGGVGWQEYGSSGAESPVGLTSWSSYGGATIAGSFEIAENATYSAFITYKAAFSTTYGDGASEEDEVPEEWFEWMATGAAASFLFSDKEAEQALLLEAQAREDLDQQLAKISRQNGNKVQTRILSHGNMQAR